MNDKVEALSQQLEQKGEEMENRFFFLIFVRILFLNNKNSVVWEKFLMEVKNIKGIFSELKNMSFPTTGATKCRVQWIKIKLHSLGNVTTVYKT